jgi:Cu+-exporting ATPase
MVENELPVSREVDDALERLEQAGQTPLLVAVNGRIVGALGVRDTVREEAAETVRQLRDLGINEIVLLTGDRAAAARQVADAVGIEQCVAELRPDEKANWLADWCGTAEDRPHVAMVGDGVNDAPALATADVGLALGGVGSDIAAEAGDLILMGDPLTPLPGLVRLSRETVRIIRQNILVFAFGVNLSGIVLTGWIMPTWSEAWLARSPVAAALFHQLGSLLVLLNAMRLLWFDRWQHGIWGRIEGTLARRFSAVARRLDPIVDGVRWSWTMRGLWVRLALFLLLAAYLSQVVVFVAPDEVGLVRRFGRFHAILPPGPHLRLPPPWDQVTREKPQRVRIVFVGLQQTGSPVEGDADETNAPRPIEWTTPHDASLASSSDEIAQILTGDQSLVELVGTVQYRVADLERYRFGVSDPERVLQALAEGVVREVVAGQPLLNPDSADAVQRELLANGRGLTERRVRDRLQRRVDQLGLGIAILPEGVCLQDLHPPRAVVAAFRDVTSAFKEKERMHNEAQAYSRQRLIEAAGKSAWRELAQIDSDLTDAEWAQLWEQLQSQLAGEAAASLNTAQAFAAEQTGRAQGDAASFHRHVAARRTEPRLTEFRLYLETLESAMPGKSKLILDRQHLGRRHLLLGLPAAAGEQILPLYESTEPIE